MNHYTNVASSNMTDLFNTLSYMTQSSNENKQSTSDSFNTIMTSIVSFNFELNKLASNLSNTQSGVTLLCSNIPPPNFHPSTPTNSAPLDDLAMLNISGFQMPPITPVPNYHYPQSSIPVQQSKFEFIRSEPTQNQNTQRCA